LGDSAIQTSKAFTRFASLVAHATGKPVTFAMCVLAIIIWALCGPVFHFSDTWQLVINTSTTIITFLQVFLIQNTQNRDGAAIQAKLDELIRASAAHNRFIGIEELTEEELTELRSRDGGGKAERSRRRSTPLTRRRTRRTIGRARLFEPEAPASNMVNDFLIGVGRVKLAHVSNLKLFCFTRMGEAR
jgi:low affinity Fe/Cu permease